MSIGFACLIVGTDLIKYKTCRLKNATPDNLKLIIMHNLKSLEMAIDYNEENKIKLFRISSDIIPFGSNNNIIINWENIFKEQLNIIADKIKKSKIRVSMHPGQYTVLNSPNEEVVKRSIEELNYHANFLDAIGVDEKSKLILHIGGVYGDKEEAINRFVRNYQHLDFKIKRRLVIENDDKSYNINDILDISKKTNIPVVYDNLHNTVNCYDVTKEDLYWIKLCSNTWNKNDGNQKVHYSQQDKMKKIGSHSTTIDVIEFIDFYNKTKDLDIDIMLEVKDKDLSAIKCISQISKLH